jgi:hypothetical protein
LLAGGALASLPKEPNPPLPPEVDPLLPALPLLPLLAPDPSPLDGPKPFCSPCDPPHALRTTPLAPSDRTARTNDRMDHLRVSARR